MVKLALEAKAQDDFQIDTLYQGTLNVHKPARWSGWVAKKGTKEKCLICKKSAVSKCEPSFMAFKK